jgi:hypothetical protein
VANRCPNLFLWRQYQELLRGCRTIFFNDWDMVVDLIEVGFGLSGPESCLR